MAWNLVSTVTPLAARYPGQFVLERRPGVAQANRAARRFVSLLSVSWAGESVIFF
ncbi:hypothetical protein [Effusibacillus consociatus]|uniref:Uncharacterized protein n=1 Tax=Effusibacillus consociatus TaxID=1117041 RepID=A0ABV9Q1A8_9BACL